MKLNFKMSISNLESRLTSHNVQDILFDLANLVNGKNYFKYEWQDAIEEVMWKIAGLEPSDETFCNCDSHNDSDGMYLINHDPNYGNYTYDYSDIESNFKPVSKKDASEILRYVRTHLESIKKRISEMDDSYYKLLIP